CNREGTLHRGEFVVFRAETRPPPGILRFGLSATESMLGMRGGAIDLSDLAVTEEYFRRLYSVSKTDDHGVQTERAHLNFANTAERVRLIDNDYARPLVVPWGDSRARVRAFEANPGRDTQRALQPFIVQVAEKELLRLQSQGAIETLHDRVHVLTTRCSGLYNATFGLHGRVDE
ncbi:MAG TPA: hypothetical protein VGO40_16520, partial [Longimicrobium sp.]|nr:hypothetical protein [Longimicrobium sp.]